MRTILFAALAGLLLVGALGAQSLIALPNYSNTYSYASHTRGFHFQAPAAFTIVGLKVPDEANHGKQNVVVFRSNGAPPTYSSLATTGLRFVSMGQPSSLWLNCHLPFNRGDYVAILGACGDPTIMHNSYGTGGYVTSIFGGSTTLFRLISQNNMASLYANKQPIPYSDNGTGSIGRVRVAIIASPDLQAKGDGSIGTTVSYTLSSPADRGLNYQMGTSFTGGPIPLGTRRVYLGIDKLLELSLTGVAPALFRGYSGALNSGGVAGASLNVPKLTALKGTRLVSAYVTLRAAAPQGIHSISGSHYLTIP